MPSIQKSGRIRFARSNANENVSPRFEYFDAKVASRAPPDEAAKTLSVLSVDMCMMENKEKHNTHKYKNSNLIVRRNKEFSVVIKFDRPFDEQQHNVQIEILIGGVPDENRGTSNIVSIGKEKRNARWKCRVIKAEGLLVTVGLTPDPKCIIGRFRLFLVVVTDLGKQRTPRNPDTDFYVLFNPWDPEDQVYMDNEDERQEYVMNDVGVIYKGDFTNVTSKLWNFGQFEQGVLETCLLILDTGRVPLMFRGNPIEVVRQASALMNAQDEDGVLVGNWSSDYTKGTAPTAWTGSPEILLKYAKDGCVPVCFGQCWVFAGILNTVMRCLGIAARVITNYCSAHDSGGNLMTDIVLDTDGRVDRLRTNDSIWNYHCWNEVYMKRPDMPDRFSGWQAIDSTPQETSDGLYRCGPTSVSAVKDGELNYSFDARFVFAELNSDVIYHQCDKFGNTQVIDVNTSYVGKLVVTKKVASKNYVDITSNYKHPEQSLKEREAMQTATRCGLITSDHVQPSETGVKIELQAEAVKMGDDFQLVMKVKNQTGKTCTVEAVITGYAVFYTGVTSSIFQLENRSSTVEASKTDTQTIAVQASDYMAELVEQSNLMFFVHGSIKETDEPLMVMKVVTLLPPELSIRVTAPLQVDKEFSIIVEFLNPYNFNLENVKLRLDSPGLMAKTKVKTYSKILPGGTVKYREAVVPPSAGKKVVMACLDCVALSQVTNQVEIEIGKAPDA